MKRIASTMLFLTVLTTGLLAEESDGITTGFFKTGIDFKNEEGGTDLGIKQILADGMIKNSDWKNFEFGYFVFRDDKSRTFVENLYVGELRSTFRARTSWGGWSSTTTLLTEYADFGLQEGLSLDYNLSKDKSVSARVNGKYTEGDSSYLSKDFSTEVAYHQNIGKGALGLSLKYRPFNVQQKEITGFGLITQSNLEDEMTWKAEYSGMFGKFFELGYVSYQTAKDTAYSEDDGQEIELLTIGALNSYNINKHYAIDVNLEKIIDLNGTKASIGETTIGTGIKYTF